VHDFHRLPFYRGHQLTLSGRYSILRLALAFLIATAVSIAVDSGAQAQIFRTKAKQGFLYDFDTGSVLFEKKSDELIGPASMAKVMTMAVVFEALTEKRLSLEDEFAVTENAWRKGGAPSGTSTMFAKLNSSIRLEDLIQGAIVQSGNDACIIIAEGMAGSEEAFARMMNEYARKLGHKKSYYTNATGLPDPSMRVTPRELAMLGDHVIRSYPDLYAFYKQKEFTWNKIRQYNRNPLLDKGLGVDGLKTGYTDESGYGIIVSAVRDRQRLIMVLSGMKSKKERATEARKLLDWGFRSFEQIRLFDKGVTVGEARVHGGEIGHVPLIGRGPLTLLVPRGSRDRIKARIVYTGPVEAPIEAGQPIGHLKVWRGEQLTQETPLYAAQSVATGTVYGRALDGLTELLTSWW